MVKAQWWFIVAEEHGAYRTIPLVVNSITKKDPVRWLTDYQASCKGGDVNVLFFAPLPRVPTKAERERFPD